MGNIELNSTLFKIRNQGPDMWIGHKESTVVLRP